MRIVNQEQGLCGRHRSSL